MVVDLFSHDTCKTANVNHRHINNKKTANIKDKNKFTTTCKVDCTYNKNCKNKKKEGDITLHYIDIMAMCCRVISPSFLSSQFSLCDCTVNLTRRCKLLSFCLLFIFNACLRGGRQCTMNLIVNLEVV